MNIEAPFRRYKDDVYRLALSYTKSVQEAEDVCQSVFLKLLQQDSLTPGKEKAWLMQVTANQCRNLLRSSWWRKTAPWEEAPETVQIKNLDVYQAVMALPPKYRVVVYLRYYEVNTPSQTVHSDRLNGAPSPLKMVQPRRS